MGKGSTLKGVYKFVTTKRYLEIRKCQKVIGNSTVSKGIRKFVQWMGKASLGATLSGFSFKNSTVGVFPIKKDVVA